MCFQPCSLPLTTHHSRGQKVGLGGQAGEGKKATPHTERVSLPHKGAPTRLKSPNPHCEGPVSSIRKSFLIASIDNYSLCPALSVPSHPLLMKDSHLAKCIHYSRIEMNKDTKITDHRKKK